MKNFKNLLLLFIFTTGLYAQVSTNKSQFQNPGPPDILIEINSLKKFWYELKHTYYWKKFQITKEGKEIRNYIDSINATFFFIGLTFDDIIDLISDKSQLCIWTHGDYIQSFVYIIKSKKENINQLFKHLKYYAIAHKISVNEEKKSEGTFLNINNKLFMLKSGKKLLLGNSLNVINNVYEKKKWFFISLPAEIKKKFQNREILINFNYSDGTKKWFTFGIKKKGFMIETAVSNTGLLKITNKIKLAQLRYVPVEAAGIATIEKYQCINKTFSELFKQIKTNYFKIPPDIQKEFLTEINKNFYLPDSIVCWKKTNYMVILPDKYTNIITGNTNFITYYRHKIYTSSDGLFFTYSTSYLLISNNLYFLKRGIEAYKKRKGFYYTKKAKIIKNRLQKIESFLFIDLKKPLTRIALSRGRDKWTWYNIYMKTMRYLFIWGYPYKNYYIINFILEGSKK